MRPEHKILLDKLPKFKMRIIPHPVMKVYMMTLWMTCLINHIGMNKWKQVLDALSKIIIPESMRMMYLLKNYLS